MSDKPDPRAASIRRPPGQLMGNEARAFAMRPLLVRSGPWVTDKAWIAHHTLQGFDRIHHVCPTNGMWRLTEHGPELVDQPIPDVAAYVAELAAAAEPCVIVEIEAPSYDTLDEARDHAVDHIDVFEVVTADDQVLRFDAQAAHLAALKQPRWTWKVAPASQTRGAAALVGFDRKNRARFALAEVAP